MEQKKQLRKQIKQMKARYSAAELRALSEKPLKQLERYLEFVSARTVLLYHSLPDEVYTHHFIEKWAGRKHIVLPVVVGNDLILRRYTGSHDLTAGEYGIAEPTGELFTDYDRIDLAIVPGLAFDRNGHRLGRGKGYYDRLLPHITARKAGLCFPFQRVEHVPTEATDVTMDEVIDGMDDTEATPHSV